MVPRWEFSQANAGARAFRGQKNPDAQSSGFPTLEEDLSQPQLRRRRLFWPWSSIQPFPLNFPWTLLQEVRPRCPALLPSPCAHICAAISCRAGTPAANPRYDDAPAGPRPRHRRNRKLKKNMPYNKYGRAWPSMSRYTIFPLAVVFRRMRVVSLNRLGLMTSKDMSL